MTYYLYGVKRRNINIAENRYENVGALKVIMSNPERFPYPAMRRGGFRNIPIKRVVRRVNEVLAQKHNLL